ncbi:MAG: aspartate aminotransferase family protein [Spirochaetia bacterium]
MKPAPCRHKKLLSDLEHEYERAYPASKAVGDRAARTLVDGGSHAIRLLEPFPPRIKSARGSYIVTEEGARILDFWQGHHANILGHNPPEITEPLARLLESGFGLQTGFTDRLQAETAEILCDAVGAENARFTTAGSLATMYAVLLARAYTGRELVMKIGGGWHGAQPWGLKGVDFHEGKERFDGVDTEGIPKSVTDQVLITRYNDPGMLEELFARYGNRTACFIMEPFIGAGGFIAACEEFVTTARELCTRYGTVLIFDEVISCFRFGPSSAAKLYGIEADLGTYGKIIGGGMPLSAVAGRKKIMELCGRGARHPVRFSGGTYSAHPASLYAAKLMMLFLKDHAEDIYPRIALLGEKMRSGVAREFRKRGISACCTGEGNSRIPGSSMGMLFFPLGTKAYIDTPEESQSPEIVDLTLTNRIIPLAMLLEGVHVVHGLGSVSAAHTEEDIRLLVDACGRAAERIVSYS